MKRIAIIGAGLSGLVLARQLNKVASVTLFEKSRGPSGRMSTRSASVYQFDHGAQYFTARTRSFNEFLKPLLAAGDVSQWNPVIVELDHAGVPVAQKPAEHSPVYVATPKMNQLGKALASGLDIRLSVRVLRLHRVQGMWQLFDDDSRSLGTFDWVISATPSAQCAELLPADFGFMPIIRQRKMSGCHALMLGFREPLDLPWEAARITNSSISWICVNSSKPGRPRDYSLLVHSSNCWAETHIDDDPDDVRIQLLTALQSVLQQDISHVDYVGLHRWRYANTEPQPDEITLLDTQMQLGACGDWCVKGTVEGAYISAMCLATQLSELL